MKKTLWTLCMALAVVFGTSMIFTGCSNNNGDDTSATENTETDRSSTDKDSVADDVGDAADDIIDGAEDAVDDIANGFDNYGDAHDYLLNQLGNDEEDGRYEVRNKTEDTTEYQDGSEGYYFEVYDTKDDSGKKYVDYYVDKDTGKIYQKNKDTNKIEEYKK